MANEKSKQEIYEMESKKFTRYRTDDNASLVQTEAVEAGGAVAFERRLRQNNFMFEGGVSFVHMVRFDPMLVQMGHRIDRQLNPRGGFVWQYDINRQWSANVDVGAVYVNPIWSDPYNPTEIRKGAAFPTFGVLAAYTDGWGGVTAQARRGVAPNLLIAQNTISDDASIAGVMPLSFLGTNVRRRAVVGTGSIGFARTQLIDPISSELQGQFNVVHFDLGVGWMAYRIYGIALFLGCGNIVVGETTLSQWAGARARGSRCRKESF